MVGDMKRLLLCTLTALALFAPAASAEPSAVVTVAEATPDWTAANIAGSVTWDACPTRCNWVPVITVQPALPSYSCVGSDWRANDPNVRQVWSGGGHASNAVVPFSLPSAPILNGVAGQRICVLWVAHMQAQHPVCLAQAPIFGYPPSTCPYLDTIIEGVLHDQVLTVAAPPPPVAPPAVAPPAKKPCSGKKGKALKKCRALAKCATIKQKAKRTKCKRAARRKYK